MAVAKVKSVALSVSHKCRNILAAGWEAHLNTVKADNKGSKNEIYTSRVHYMIHKGTPYLIVPENDMHNINIIIDERGSLAVFSPIRGRVASLLKPSKEHEAASKASYGVSAILSSAGATCRSRSEGLLSLLSEESSYNILKFDIGSCVYIDFNGSSHNIELDSFEAPKADLLMPFSAKLVDGINQNDSRRRALVMFCFAYFNVIARSAVMLSIDHHGFDVLAKVPQGDILTNPQYHWKEFRFTFKEPAKDAEDFCRMLVGLEEEGLQTVKSCSGYG
uniref:DUF2470 domain-containing protein n=1 Tax=Zea mays TaxID=4577 RepID=A0A804LI17_MAIZE